MDVLNSRHLTPCGPFLAISWLKLHCTPVQERNHNALTVTPPQHSLVDAVATRDAVQADKLRNQADLIKFAQPKEAAEPGQPGENPLYEYYKMVSAMQKEYIMQ